MTRKEAIEILHNIKAENLNLDDAYTKRRYDALVTAIDTMKQYERLKAITSKSDYVLTAIEMGLPLIIGFIIGKWF